MAIPLPIIPLPAIGLPGLGLPGQSGSPALPSPAALASGGIGVLNALLAQSLTNPLAALGIPIQVPAALAAQFEQKAQSGTLSPQTTNVSIPLSGGYMPLEAQSTPITKGQLYNNSPKTIGITTPPQSGGSGDPGSAIPVAPGGTFNFGAVDLSLIWVGNITDFGAVNNLKIYMEK